jgi:hypothetical protein
MSDVTVSVVENTTSVVVSNDVVEINVTESPVTISTAVSGPQGATGPQGASYAQGDPIFVTVRNATGATLPKGTIVYISGSNGNHVQVTPAIATSDATSARTLGWLAESIANNASGLCQVEGYLEGLDTQGLTSGSQLYLSGTVAGAFQVAKPQAPIHLVYVGVVTKVSAGDGHVFVKVQNGYELEELHDVQIISPVNNHVLTYYSETDLWKNATNPADGVTSITATAPLTGGTITSTGSIGIDQTALSIAQSQVTSLVSDLANTAKLNTANTFTVGGHVITNAAVGTIPLQINAISGQTANLFDVKNSSGTSYLNVNNVGSLQFGSGSGSFLSGANGRVNVQLSGDNIGVTIRGFTSQTANMQEWQTNTGTVQARVTSGGSIVTTQGFAVLGGASISGSTAALFQSSSAARIPVTVQGAASQSANLQEWQNSAGSILGRVDSGGNVFGNSIRTTSSVMFIGTENSGAYAQFTKASSALAVPGATGYAKLYFRDGTTAGTLKLVVRAGAAGAETTILDNIPQ